MRQLEFGCLTWRLGEKNGFDGDGREDWLTTDNTDAGIARHGYALICGDDQCTSVSRERASVPSVVRSPLRGNWHRDAV